MHNYYSLLKSAYNIRIKIYTYSKYIIIVIYMATDLIYEIFVKHVSFKHAFEGVEFSDVL